MTGDREALLAAIVADPADDTVRLAYADCTEEEGNSARAEFIRVQVEAERLHPDSNARARLESRAEALFAEHWVEWWGEVCAATGLFYPRRGPKTRLGRAAWWLANFGAEVDNPYTRSGFTVDWSKRLRLNETSIPAWAEFRRGFPESVVVSGSLPTELASWSNASPLLALTLDQPDLLRWTVGPALNHVRSLTLRSYDPFDTFELFTSPELANLEELHCSSILVTFPALVPHRSELVLALVIDCPRATQLKRLALPELTENAIEVLSATSTLTQLEALSIPLTTPGGGAEDAARVAGRLSESPFLAGLRELDVTPPFSSSEVCRLLTQRPVWQGLRKLTISDEVSRTSLRGMLQDANLPALEEVRFHSIGLTREVIDLLIEAPLMKQLKHFAIGAWGVDGVADADLRRLPEMFDLDRIETFRFHPDHQMPGLDALQEKLGDRLRMA